EGTGRSPRAASGASVSSAAEPTAPPGVGEERLAELIGAEVGPQRLHEDELGVRQLPEQEVRDPKLAGCPDEQVGVGQLGCVQLACESVLVHLARLDARFDQPAP